MEGTKELMEKMLGNGDTMLCIDSRHKDVHVPENHRGKADLRLILNLNFRRPIEVTDDGVRAELLFGGAPFMCWIPYASVWGVYNPNKGEGYLWPAHLPREVRDLLEPGRAGTLPGKPSKLRIADAALKETTRKTRPSLRVIPGRKKD